MALPKDRVAGRCNCSFADPSSHSAGTVQAGTKSVLSINLANTLYPAWRFPEAPPHPVNVSSPNPFWWLFYRRDLPRFMLCTFLKFLRRLQTSDK